MKLSILNSNATDVNTKTKQSSKSIKTKDFGNEVETI